MTVQLQASRTTRRPPLAPGAAATATASAVASPEPLRAHERAISSSQDRARYHCHCGHVFEAPVTTSVGCPHCGAAQAW